MCLVDIAADNPDPSMVEGRAEISGQVTPRDANVRNYAVEGSAYARKITVALRRLGMAFDALDGAANPGELSQVKWFFRMFHSGHCLSWKDLGRDVDSNCSRGQQTNMNKDDGELKQKLFEKIQSSFRGSDNLDTLLKFQQTLSILLNESSKYMQNRVHSCANENGGKTPRRHGLICQILMDVLKASEWTVDEMQNDNPFSLTEEDESQSDSFENDCTNYILLFTPYPKSIDTLKRLLNTPSAIRNYGKTPCGSPLSNSSAQSSSHENGGVKSLVEGMVDSVYTLLHKSFQKMSIKLLWVDTSKNDLERSCEMVQGSNFRCFDSVPSNRHKSLESDFCVQACKKLSQRLGISGFNIRELFYKPQLASIGQALARHLLDHGVTGSRRCKNNLSQEQNMVRALFQCPMYLGITNTAPKSVNKQNHSVDLEIFCIGEYFDGNIAKQMLLGNTDLTGCNLVVEHLLSYEVCTSVFTTNLSPYLCRPKLDGDSHVAIEKFQTLMMYLSTKRKCALISVYKPVSAKTNRYRKRFPHGKLMQILLLKPFTPALGLISEMSSLMDQIKNLGPDGNLSESSPLLGKEAESVKLDVQSMFRPGSEDTNDNICQTSILLKLNQNYSVVRSTLHLESSMSSRTPTHFIRDGNQTDSSQMTMIVSSSEGEDEDVFKPNDERGGTEKDCGRGNESIDFVAGGVHCNGVSSSENDINSLIFDYGVEHLVHYDTSKVGLGKEDFDMFERVDTSTALSKENTLSQVTSPAQNLRALRPSSAAVATPDKIAHDLRHNESAYELLKKEYLGLLEKSKNNDTTPVLYYLTKQVLPSLYTRLGSSDGTNKDLEIAICKEARRFIKDNLLIGKSDLRSKYSAKNMKKAISGTDSAIEGNKFRGYSRGSKIHEYQMQIYLRIEVASLARASSIDKSHVPESVDANRKPLSCFKPRDPIKRKNLDDICSLLQSISFLMDANAKLKAQSNGQIGNSSNTTNITLSKFLDIYLVTNFKSILPLTLYEIHEELNVELPASLVGIKANMDLNDGGINAGVKASPSSGNESTSQGLPKQHFSLSHRSNTNKDSASRNGEVREVMSGKKSSKFLNSGNRKIKHAANACPETTDGDSNIFSSTKLSVNSSLERAGGLVNERKALLNNFTQKLTNPRLLFRSVVVPKGKSGKRSRGSGKFKGGSTTGNSSNRCQKRGGSSNRLNAGRRREQTSKKRIVVEETPDRKQSSGSGKRRKQGTISNEDSGQQNTDSRHSSSTKFVKKNSFRQLF